MKLPALLTFFFTTLAFNKVHSQVDSIINKFLTKSPNGTSISIAIIENDSTVFLGYNKINDSLVQVNNSDSVYEIGSITKVFTSTLLANLILDDKIKPNEKVHKHIAFKLHNKPKFTFQQLSNHTSGLPRLPSNSVQGMTLHPENPYKGYSESMLENYLKNSLNLNQKPGEKYEYSNLGVGLLGYTISKIENKNYEDLLSTTIFEKYSMSYSTTNRSLIKKILVKGRKQDGEITSNWDIEALAPAGQIYSSAYDLSLFIEAQFDKSNKELQFTQEKTYEVNEKLSIGYGWHILKSKNETPFYFHNGRTGGYSSSCVFEPNKKIGIIILSNLYLFDEIDKISISLLESKIKD